MTGLQMFLLAGAVIGAGAAMLLWRMVPAQPDLQDVLTRLSPDGARPRPGVPADAATGVAARMARWATGSVPVAWWGRIRESDLAILGRTRHEVYTEKFSFAAIGLVSGPVLGYLAAVLGVGVGWAVPAVVTLAAAALLFMVPNHNLADDAGRARSEFRRALTSYIDLVALERVADAGTRQALESAAGIAGSWPFRRISEELARTRWSGETSWQALRGLGDRLGVSELHDLADIMRLSGEDGAVIYGHLRARAAGMRNAQRTDDRARANQVSEKLTLPMTLLVVLFLALLMTAPLLRLALPGGL